MTAPFLGSTRAGALAAALLFTSRLALAQGDTRSQDGVARYTEGLALHAAGREEDAYVKFAEAYAALQTPPVLFDLARSEQLTRRWLDASAHYTEYLALPDGPKVSARSREKARAFLEQTRAQLGHLAVTTAPGALVLVDGRALAQPAPLAAPVDVLPGDHAVEARLDGRVQTKTASPAAGQTIALELPFEAVSAPPAPPPSPSVVAQPPVTPPVLPPPEPPRDRARFVVAAGVGAVALVAVGVGVGLELVASGSARDADNEGAAIPSGASACVPATPACQQRNDDRQSAQDKRNAAAGFFVAGGALAVASVGVLLLWPRPKGAPSEGGLRIVVEPVVSQGMTGARIGGTF